MIDTVAANILALPVWVALALVFALPALESSAFLGFIFPGEVAVILGGVLAYEGRASLVAVLAAGILGAIAGDSVGYLVGRRYGRGLLEGTLGRFINHKHFDRAERYLAVRGGKAVFFGRFTAALRVMVPGLAGMSRMHYPTFAAYNIAGGAIWATMCTLLGYLGGSSWRHVEHLTSRIGVGALIVVVAGFAGGYVLRRTGSGRVRGPLNRVRSSRSAAWLVGRFPRTVAWFGRRLDPSCRTGLPLTVMAVVAVAATWTFLGVTQDVLASEEVVLLDPRVHSWALTHRPSWLTRALQAMALLGSKDVVVPVLLAAGALASWTRRSWRPVVDVIVVFGAALLSRAVVAELVHRRRPPVADWLTGASGWSYPSGHTIQATVGCGILLALAAQGRVKRTVVLLTGGAVWVVLGVAVSRVYLGVHWLSDVLGSMSLGTALLSVWGIARLSLDFRGLAENVDPTDARALPDGGRTGHIEGAGSHCASLTAQRSAGAER
jgi:membrane protein DedA with SNARE-associated domain/membrane-associated phospholipid phosphatase